jgi:hypothetical protein
MPGRIAPFGHNKFSTAGARARRTSTQPRLRGLKDDGEGVWRESVAGRQGFGLASRRVTTRGPDIPACAGRSRGGSPSTQSSLPSDLAELSLVRSYYLCAQGRTLDVPRGRTGPGCPSCGGLDVSNAGRRLGEPGTQTSRGNSSTGGQAPLPL